MSRTTQETGIIFKKSKWEKFSILFAIFVLLILLCMLGLAMYYNWRDGTNYIIYAACSVPLILLLVCVMLLLRTCSDFVSVTKDGISYITQKNGVNFLPWAEIVAVRHLTSMGYLELSGNRAESKMLLPYGLVNFNELMMLIHRRTTGGNIELLHRNVFKRKKSNNLTEWIVLAIIMLICLWTAFFKVRSSVFSVFMVTFSVFLCYVFIKQDRKIIIYEDGIIFFSLLGQKKISFAEITAVRMELVPGDDGPAYPVVIVERKGGKRIKLEYYDAEVSQIYEEINRAREKFCRI